MSPGDIGVISHVWATAPGGMLGGTTFRYYVDGESTAGIQFELDMACGVGFNDTQAPWGTKWFGKGAADGAWFNNFRIPFTTIRVTAQRLGGATGGFYFIIRGNPLSSPIRIGDFELPPQARMKMIRTVVTVPAYSWVPLVEIPSGSGLFFMHTLAVSSVDMNFLEGCYHAYTPYSQTFPGTLLSTGTEDYFDSAWYFNAGEFHLPVSGFTHLAQGSGSVTWSAYRFHEMDTLAFEDGFKFVWRNGDVSSGGVKCLTETGPGINGGVGLVRPGANPNAPGFGVASVLAFAWVYTW